MDVLKPGRLGANITLAEHILFVAPNCNDVFTIVLDFDATHRLAEMAGAIMKLRWAVAGVLCHAILVLILVCST